MVAVSPKATNNRSTKQLDNVLILERIKIYSGSTALAWSFIDISEMSNQVYYVMYWNIFSRAYQMQ